MSPKVDAQVRREDQEETLARFEKLAGGALQASLKEEDRAKQMRSGMRAVGEITEEENTPEALARRRAQNRFQSLQGGAQPTGAQDLNDEGTAAPQMGLVASGAVAIADEAQDPVLAQLREHSLPSDPLAQEVRRNLQLSDIRADGPLAAAAAQIGDITRDAIRNLGDTAVLAKLGDAFDGVAGLADRATGGAVATGDVAEIAKGVVDFAIRKGVKPGLLVSVASAVAA